MIRGVSDPHPFHKDPDPGFQIFADPDPGFQIFADPDPWFEIFADPDKGLDFFHKFLFLGEKSKNEPRIHIKCGSGSIDSKNADLMQIRICNPADPKS